MASVVVHGGVDSCRRFPTSSWSTQLLDKTQGGASVAVLDDGRVIVVWHSFVVEAPGFQQIDIRARIFSPDHSEAAIGDAPPDFLISASPSGYRFFSPDVVGLADGRYVVTWTAGQLASGENDIRGRVFNADGTSTEFVINNTMLGDQQTSALTALADGRFMVTWTSFEDASGSYDIRGRVFNNDGTPSIVNGTISDFVINTTLANGQFSPNVEGLMNGGFVVSWQSDEGDQLGIRLRVFHSEGGAVRVNGTTDDFLIGDASSNFHSLAALADGRFVRVWDGVHGQLFNADGTTYGGELAISTSTGGESPERNRVARWAVRGRMGAGTRTLPRRNHPRSRI